jgi:hypothetical protein
VPENILVNQQLQILLRLFCPNRQMNYTNKTTYSAARISYPTAPFLSVRRSRSINSLLQWLLEWLTDTALSNAYGMKNTGRQCPAESSVTLLYSKLLRKRHEAKNKQQKIKFSSLLD